MKNSGIEWIGEIPNDWDIDKCNRLFRIIGSGTTPRDENIFENGSENWIQSGDIKGEYINRCKNKIREKSIFAYSALKKYEAPFIVIAMYGASVGNIAISKINACVNQACCVLAMPKTNLKYLYYALFSVKNYLIQKALGGGQPNISQEIIRQLRLPNPSDKIQQKIADYLDEKCVEIDGLIFHEQSTIEELKAYKQSVITEAVTKGLDKSVPMKNSEVEWIGEIPESWSVSKIKLLADTEKENSFIDGDWIESPYIEQDGIRYITTGNIGDGVFKQQGNGFISEKTFIDLQCKYAYAGDLIFSRLNEEYGRSCILPNDYDKYVIAVDNVILKTKENKRYICYVSQCPNYHKAVFFYARGTAMKRISRTNLGNVNIPLPKIQEQIQIANYLDKKCAEIDNLISIKQQKIEGLKEYKKSLIYEYVTGKKEVC